MFYHYFSLFLVFFVYISLFYGVIALCDIPRRIAAKRNHPHQDAIQVAGWVSLFTLHAIWPFLWIWASLYNEEHGWGFQSTKDLEKNKVLENQVAQLQSRLDMLEQTLLQAALVKPENSTSLKNSNLEGES
ncbi:MAG: DUF3302 domain-containing protein [Methyloprofundus sp.]|nr:DUF3302 domain-containing protein [Methyloprofundus sp.]